jgi:demethylmenaquinone methyltransferase/2-methoxy-6-polyprenyl-1,4-benzoquinol methylase
MDGEMIKGRKKARYIHKMFTDLSGRYDKVSTAIALRRDGSWRDFAASMVDGASGRILDVCCGTGELSIRLLEKTGSQVVAVDFCENMVDQAKKKFGNGNSLNFGVADAERLPFTDDTFTCATVAFALRNVTDIRRVISEMTRVVKKRGKIIILDLGKPSSSLIRKFYYCYFYQIIPRIGGLFAREGSYAYEYLPHSLTHFPAQEGIKSIMGDVGLVDVQVHNLTKGIAAVHVGTKP